MINPRTKKICFVTPIFSAGALGGAEKLVWEYANLLSSEQEVTVLTTTASDYRTWENHHPEGESNQDGIKIIRFPVEKERNIKSFNKKIHKFIRNRENLSDSDFQSWLEIQGPFSPQLYRYIDQNKNEIPLFFFVTYLYYTTAYCLPLVKHKSICALTLHDEVFAYFPQYKNIFTNDVAYSFNTIEEELIFEKVFHRKPEIYSITGINVEIPKTGTETLDIPKNPYILYMGRIDKGKGIFDLIEYYTYWKKNSPNVPELYLMGGGNIPDHAPPGVHFLGFVPEEQKSLYLKHCEFLVNPSPMESFSIVMMEAWLLEKAVLVNANCDTMRNHCRRSNAGLYFSDRDSFLKTADYLLSNPEVKKGMGKNGKKYVELNYSSITVKNKLINLINKRMETITPDN